LRANVKVTDMWAVASFNLLGVQPYHGPVNWDWVDRCLKVLEADSQPGELQAALLRTRYEVLTGQMQPAVAGAQYNEIYRSTEPGTRFSFDGVKDRSRVDSYFDPFGNLDVRQRALLEAGREQYKRGHSGEANRARKRLLDKSSFSRLQELQLSAYWDEYVLGKD